ncbi:MAG: hypothetical protein JWN14_5134 [Chthonomonadales bacterium]|nr:hypothetical protein [Chthonomonadales bacterium]
MILTQPILLAGCIAALSLTVQIAAAPALPDAVPLVARPLPLSAVRLTGGPLKQAQDLDAAYLLKLEPDRMMAYYRKRAGLTPKAAGYGGWDGDGKNLTGHIAGHYLSAVSLMYAATGDNRFKERADYLVKEMKEVQDKHGNGYLGALEHGEERFAEVAQGNIRSGGFDLNGLWSPWYVLHKTYAGLRDAYRFTGNRTALEEEIKFAEWAEGILAHLDAAQTQRMLDTEFGGMNEALADLYADTGDKRWLALSDRFQHHVIVDPLAQHKDILVGKHGNTQVPKLLGSLARYRTSGNQADGQAATFFWDAIVDHHTYVTGGHGKDEYFFAPDKISDNLDGRTAESCNVYNMLKMTRLLFALHPDVKYAEFQERALFNHVLASIDPNDGRTCYMVPVGRDVRHEYQDMFQNFTCCVGSGMESHALHGDGIYYEAGDRFWVNLYAPSTADWTAAGMKLAMETTFPEGETATARLTLRAPRAFTLLLRRPSWAGKGFTVTVNGKAVPDIGTPGAYVALKRTWKTGDTVALTLPKVLHTEPTPDNARRVALMWGPLALAGDLGSEREANNPAKQAAVPIFVAAEKPLTEWLEPVADRPGAFHSVGVGRSSDHDQPHEVTFLPFYRLHERAYSVYCDLYTPADWKQKAAEIAAEQERQRKLQAATVSFVQPGEMQPERNFNQQGEETYPERVLGRAGRNGRKWFSFDMPVDSAHPLALVVTYHGGERRRTATFDILIDGTKIATQEIARSLKPGFFDAEYALPADKVKDKQKVTVRFQVQAGSEIAAVFGIRVIRADMPR